MVDLERAAVGQRDRDRLVRPDAVGGGVGGGRVGGGEALLDGLVDAVAHVVLDVVPPGPLGVGQRDAVLRALGAGDRRDDGGQVELDVLGEHRLGRGRVEPEALLLGVGLDEGDLLLGTAGQAQVVDGLAVDREDRAGGAELGAHVADRGPVGQRHGGDALAVELDELADHAVLAQDLGDRQHQVGGGGPGGQLAAELEADHARDEHGDRLAEHRGLGLDAADAPAEHADAVFHRGVRVGADAGVGVGPGDAVGVAGHDHAGQVLDVDLVHDAGAGRDDLELVEGRLAPAQELVALAVALVFALDVALEGVGVAEVVDDDRVVDDHLGRRQRVDPGGVAAEVAHGLAHGGQVDHAGHAGEVLHDDAAGRELDLHAGRRLGVPAAQRTDVVGRDVGAVLGAEKVFQQDLQAVREACGAFYGIQPEDLVCRVADA